MPIKSKYMQFENINYEGEINMRIIMGIEIKDRNEDAVSVQELLTKHGCIIKTRLGLHENAQEGFCSSAGLIILEFLKGHQDEVEELESHLLNLKSVSVRRMEF